MYSYICVYIYIHICICMLERAQDKFYAQMEPHTCLHMSMNFAHKIRLLCLSEVAPVIGTCLECLG